MFHVAGRVALGAVLTLMLAGCQTRAQQQISQSGEIFRAANDSRRACLAPLEGNPTYEPIARRTAPPTSSFARPALERLGDPDKASEAEVQLMRERFDIFARCEEAYAAAITPASPDHELLSRWAITERTQNVLRLTRREITWGEYNQQADAVQARVAERDRHIATARQQELQVMHNAEMAHRQQAALFMQQQQMMQQRAQQESQRQFQQQMMQQQVINSMNRPVMTNYNRFGNTVNCMSY